MFYINLFWFLLVIQTYTANVFLSIRSSNVMSNLWYFLSAIKHTQQMSLTNQKFPFWSKFVLLLISNSNILSKCFSVYPVKLIWPYLEGAITIFHQLLIFLGVFPRSVTSFFLFLSCLHGILIRVWIFIFH